jgi:hypothetical protein
MIRNTQEKIQNYPNQKEVNYVALQIRFSYAAHVYRAFRFNLKKNKTSYNRFLLSFKLNFNHCFLRKHCGEVYETKNFSLELENA